MYGIWGDHSNNAIEAQAMEKAWDDATEADLVRMISIRSPNHADKTTA